MGGGKRGRDEWNSGTDMGGRKREGMNVEQWD